MLCMLGKQNALSVASTLCLRAADRFRFCSWELEVRALHHSSEALAVNANTAFMDSFGRGSKQPPSLSASASASAPTSACFRLVPTLSRTSSRPPSLVVVVAPFAFA